MSQSCTNKIMDGDAGSLPDNVNPGTFPAKLWRLVNNPETTSICWDHLGETILINEELFKSQILSPSLRASDNPDSFKTNKFCSFVRQLNLYGFKKNVRTVRVNLPFENGTYHCFYHKNFNRNHPELIADLKRLTADNKAKLSAGLKVSHRPWTRRSGSGECKNKKRTAVLAPTHLYCPDNPQAPTTNISAPVYPLYLMNGSNDAAALPEIPVPLNQQNTEAVPCSGPVHIQQSVPTYTNHGIPNFTSYDPHTAQNPPGLYSECKHSAATYGFQYYHANILTPHMAGSGLQFRPYAPYHCYQIAEKLVPPPTSSLPVKLQHSETAATGFNHMNQEIIVDNCPSHDTHRMDTGGSKSSLKLQDATHFDPSMAPSSSRSAPTIQIPIC